MGDKIYFLAPDESMGDKNIFCSPDELIGDKNIFRSPRWKVHLWQCLELTGYKNMNLWANKNIEIDIEEY